MPIYEYRCDACGHRLDALQKVSDAPLTDCPECGRSELKRQLSAPSFRLKGGGWYETDFKDKNRRNVIEAGDGAKADKAETARKDAKDGKEAPKVDKPAATETGKGGAKAAGDKASTPKTDSGPAKPTPGQAS
jgi:putative FmdB family regulatory protein